MLVARRRGVADLRQVGDRNPGYWNARTTLGRRAAVPVFVGDAAKGAVAAGVGVAISDDWRLGYVGAGAAMVGHAWPVFARFRGGRSVLDLRRRDVRAGAAGRGDLDRAAAGGVGTTRSFAWAARVGVFGFPVVQLLVEGPYRTAATGCLMTFIGLRFAMARQCRRRRAIRPAG